MIMRSPRSREGVPVVQGREHESNRLCKRSTNHVITEALVIGNRPNLGGNKELRRIVFYELL